MAFRQTLGNLSVTISADTSSFDTAQKRVRGELSQTDQVLAQSEQRWSNWKKAIVALGSGISLGLIARETMQLSDAMTSVTNKLKLATDGTEQLTRVTASLFNVAKGTRSNFESTAELYAKLERSTRDLGLSEERLLKVTESVNKSFAISGASTQEAAGAIRQLGQALASGVLRGDEFNSIAEQAPIIMEAVKKATGETAGALRELAADGKLTAEVLVKSLEDYADTIDSEFATATATYSQKLEIARTNAIEFVGANEAITDAVGATGDAIVFLSENLDNIVKAVGVLAVAIGSRLTVSLVASTAAALRANVTYNATTMSYARMTAGATAAAAATRGLSLAMGALGGPVGILITAVSALVLFSDSTDSTTARMKALGEATKVTTERFISFKQQARELDSTLTKAQAIKQIEMDIKSTEQALRRAQKTYQGTLRSFEAGKVDVGILDQTKSDVDELTEKLQVLQNRLTEVRNRAEGATGGINLRGDDDERSAESLVQEEAARELAELEKLAAKRDELRQRELERRKQHSQAIIMEMQTRLATLTEQEGLRHANQLIAAQEAFNLGLITREEQNLLIEELTREHQENLTSIEEEEAKKRAEIARREMVEKINNFQMAANALLAMNEAFGSKSQKQQKRQRRAEIIMNAAAGIARAYAEHNFYVATGIAAVIAANAKRQLDAVNRASSGGGGSIGGGVSTGGVSTDGGGGGQQLPQRSFNINLVGEGNFTPGQVRDLIEMISEQVEGNGVRLAATVTTGG